MSLSSITLSYLLSLSICYRDLRLAASVNLNGRRTSPPLFKTKGGNMTDENLEQRLTNIENAIERLAHYIAGGHSSSHKAEINKEDFTRLYNNVKYTIPITFRLQ